MKLLRWPFGPPRFRRCEDSYARNQNSQLAGLREAIDSQAHSDQVFVLVAHFSDSFTSLQDALESWSIDYEVVTSAIDSNWLAGLDSIAGKKPVYLTLAEMLTVETTRMYQRMSAPLLGVIAIDLHPLPEKDFRLEQYCRSLPCPVELGYFLSFDDVVVRQAISDNAIRILDLFGMRENELVTSLMISRRLKQFLTRRARLYGTDHPAPSAAEWFIANKPNQPCKNQRGQASLI